MDWGHMTWATYSIPEMQKAFWEGFFKRMKLPTSSYGISLIIAYIQELIFQEIGMAPNCSYFGLLLPYAYRKYDTWERVSMRQRFSALTSRVKKQNNSGKGTLWEFQTTLICLPLMNY